MCEKVINTNPSSSASDYNWYTDGNANLDLSPIEEAFSKLNAHLRQAQACTHEALHEAIAQALTPITAQDAQGCFSHCGYMHLYETKGEEGSLLRYLS